MRSSKLHHRDTALLTSDGRVRCQVEHTSANRRTIESMLRRSKN